MAAIRLAYIAVLVAITGYLVLLVYGWAFGPRVSAYTEYESRHGRISECIGWWREPDGTRGEGSIAGIPESDCVEGRTARVALAPVGTLRDSVLVFGPRAGLACLVDGATIAFAVRSERRARRRAAALRALAAPGAALTLEIEYGEAGRVVAHRETGGHWGTLAPGGGRVDWVTGPTGARRYGLSRADGGRVTVYQADGSIAGTVRREHRPGGDPRPWYVLADAAEAPLARAVLDGGAGFAVLDPSDRPLARLASSRPHRWTLRVPATLDEPLGALVTAFGLDVERQERLRALP